MKNQLIAMLVSLGLLSQTPVYAQTDSLGFFAFKQGAAKNCASVAIIKAGIYKYGIGNVFRSANKDGSTHIWLKNQQELDLTAKEINQAAQRSAFLSMSDTEKLDETSAKVITYADSLYAIIAKYIQVNGYSECGSYAITRKHSSSFKSALKFISNKGICTDNAYRYLGLSIKDTIYDYTPAVNFNVLPPGVVLYTDEHAVAVYKSYADAYGEPTLISSPMKVDTFTFEPLYYFVLK